MRSLLPLAFALLLCAVPVQAQSVGIHNPEVSTPTSLYFHVIDLGDMPINTQVPDPDFAAQVDYMPGSATLKCLHPVTGDIANSGQGTKGMTAQVLHTSYGYSSPSYVEYDYVGADGKPRVHPERGISYDALIDQAYPSQLEWYVAVYNGGQPQDQVPTPTPGVVVAVQMRGGDAISVDDRAYDSGPMLAQGRTEPANLVPSPVPGVGGAYGMDGQPHPQVDFLGQVDDLYVFRFRVPLAFEADRIARATGYNVRIDMFVDNPYCKEPTDVGKEYVMPSTLAVYSSAQARPRLDLAVTDPIRVEYLHPQVVGDDLVIHTALNSVWGNYDVQENTTDGIRVWVEGPTEARSLAKAAFVQRFHDHYHHQEAVDVTYVWDYHADHAADGVYKVFVEFTNDQGTAKASGVGQFTLGKGQAQVIGCGGVQESSQALADDCVVEEDLETAGPARAPGLSLLVVLGALGAVAALVRRVR